MSIITPWELGPIRVYESRLPIWCGPEDGDGDGKRGLIAGDWRSLALLKLDLSKVELICLKGPTRYTSTAERIARVEEKFPNHIRLDPRFAVSLCECPEAYPDSWKDKIIFWDGFSVLGQGGDRLALCTYWSNDGVHLDYTDGWYDDSRKQDEFSAVLAMDQAMLI